MTHRIFTLSVGILTFLLLILSVTSATARDIKVNTEQYRAEADRTVNAKKAEIADITRQARATSQAATINANKSAQTSQIKQQPNNKAAQNTQPGQTIQIGNEEEPRAPEDTGNNTKNTTPHITVGNIVQTQNDPGGNQVIEIGKGTNSDKIKTGNIVQSGSGNKKITIGNP